MEKWIIPGGLAVFGFIAVRIYMLFDEVRKDVKILLIGMAKKDMVIDGLTSDMDEVKAELRSSKHEIGKLRDIVIAGKK